MNELDNYSQSDPGPMPEGMPGGMPEGFEGDLGDAFGTMIREFQRAKLRNWFIRTAIGAALFGYLAFEFSWGRWILYIWIPIALLSLLAIVFLPKILQNKMQTMFQGGMQPGQNPFGAAFDMGAMPGMGGMPESHSDPIDVDGEVIDVETDGPPSIGS